MLKQRVITAIIIAVVLLAAVFVLTPFYFAIACAVVFALAAWEWSQFSRLTGVGRWLFALIFALLIIATGAWIGVLDNTLHTSRVLVVVAVASGWWLIAAVLVKAYPKMKSTWSSPFTQALMGLLVILPTWSSLVYLHGQPFGHWLIVILVVCVACADIGAYFVGRRWGKNKLAPSVSPGKSLEGFYGGFVCSALFALVLTLSLGRPQDWWLFAFIIPASLVSVLGDLLESMMKRERGIKDSGRILPGHGGILDRVDSVTAAAPIFTLGYILSAWQW